MSRHLAMLTQRLHACACELLREQLKGPGHASGFATEFIIRLGRLQHAQLDEIQHEQLESWARTWYDERETGRAFRARWPRLKAEVEETHRRIFERTAELEDQWSRAERLDPISRQALAFAILTHARCSIEPVSETVASSPERLEVANALIERIWPTQRN